MPVLSSNIEALPNMTSKLTRRTVDVDHWPWGIESILTDGAAFWKDAFFASRAVSDALSVMY